MDVTNTFSKPNKKRKSFAEVKAELLDHEDVSTFLEDMKKTMTCTSAVC
jgi:hypothetical protein